MRLFIFHKKTYLTNKNNKGLVKKKTKKKNENWIVF